MTAEGDNSVLMQKVAKERLAVIQKQGFPELTEANPDLSNPKYCLRLLETRERTLYERLGKSMATAGREGLFTAWMMEESDLIQAAGRAYGERLVAERFLIALQESDDDLKPMLTTLFSLYALSTMEENMAQLVILDVITPAQVSYLDSSIYVYRYTDDSL